MQTLLSFLLFEIFEFETMAYTFLKLWHILTKITR